MERSEIPLKEIRKDFFFRFTRAADLSRLIESIAQSGVRNPVSVYVNTEGYQLVGGFSRFQAAEKVKLKTIPACVSDEDLVQMFREVILEHLTGHCLNLVEKARILLILEKLSVSMEQLKDTFLTLLELPNQSKFLEALKTIAGWPEAMQDYIETYNLSQKQCGLFFSLKNSQMSMIADMARHLSIRPLELSEIASGFLNVCRRKDVSFKTLFDDLQLSELLKDTDLTRQQKIDHLRKKLRETEYPQLTKLNHKMEKLDKSVDTPSSVRILWDRTFENPGIRIQAEIRGMGDLSECTSFLSDKNNRGRITKMLEIAG